VIQEYLEVFHSKCAVSLLTVLAIVEIRVVTVPYLIGMMFRAAAQILSTLVEVLAHLLM
jgi:hypothetical protein